MRNKITLLFYFLGLFTCFAQQSAHTPIDTTGVAFRQQLKVIYTNKAAKRQLEYKNFPEKNLRATLMASGKELDDDFIEKLNKGFFIQNEFYEEYINTIFQQIVKANPQYGALASSKILLSFAEEPNACAIGNGIVIVNLPLLANVKNKYELAFILCHELAHNLLSHPENGLVKYARIKNSDEIKKQTREIEKQKYNKGASAVWLFRKVIYGSRKEHREIEFQADSLGFVLYRNAFSGKEQLAVDSFTTLDGMDKEKDSLQLSDYEKLFSSEKLPFKKEWLAADELSAYKYDKTPRTWQIDSLKTHPDCADRALRLKTYYSAAGSVAPDAEVYGNMAKRAGYDDVMGLYVLKEYGKSLYRAMLLLKDDTNNAYLRRMVYANLTKIQASQKNYTMNKYVETVAPRYTESYNTFLSFLRQLRKSEMAEIINQYST